MNHDPLSDYPPVHNSVRDFYERQVLENPEFPAILGVTSKLASDLRDREEWRTFQKLALVHREMSVLELGCGGGRWCEHLAPLVRLVSGVDFSTNALAHARRRAEAGELHNIEYHESSIEVFQPSRMYDLIYFSAVVPYLSDHTLEMCISRYASCLNERGVIVVRDSVANITHTLEHEQGYTARYRTLDDYKGFFGRAGFDLVRFEKAFPRFCLSPLLSNRVISRLNEVLPSLLKPYLLDVFSLLSLLSSDGTHWRSGAYAYDHYFFVFSRIS